MYEQVGVPLNRRRPKSTTGESPGAPLAIARVFKDSRGHTGSLSGMPSRDFAATPKARGVKPQRSLRLVCAGGVIRPPSLRLLPHLAGTRKARAANLATGGARVKFLASDESRRPVICVDIRALVARLR